MKLFNRLQLENIKMSSPDEHVPRLHGLRIEGNSTVATDGHRLMKVTYKPSDLTNDEIKAEFADKYPEGEGNDPTDEELANVALEVHNRNQAQAWPANGVAWDWSHDEPFTVQRKTIEKALKNMPKKEDYPILNNMAIGRIVVDQLPGDPRKKGEMVDGPQKLACQTTDIEHTENIEAQIAPGAYPDYEKVIPANFETDKDFHKVLIDGKLLREMLAQLEKFDPLHNHKVTLYINDSGPHIGEHPIVMTADNREGTTALGVLMPLRN